MNIQTERLEDQTARVTVEIDTERLDTAKQKAAQQISRKVNIPGFRKGKVPYRVLLNYVGEAAILEDAVELLSQEVYKEVLPQTDLEPVWPRRSDGCSVRGAAADLHLCRAASAERRFEGLSRDSLAL